VDTSKSRRAFRRRARSADYRCEQTQPAPGATLVATGYAFAKPTARPVCPSTALQACTALRLAKAFQPWRLLAMQTSLELLVRIVIAGALGALIGYERDLHRRPAGLRTHMIIEEADARVITHDYVRRFGEMNTEVTFFVNHGAQFDTDKLVNTLKAESNMRSVRVEKLA
jgi:hypothetical protein